MNRRLPLILVAGVLALCVIGVVVVGIDAGSGFGAVAYTGGDTGVSQQSVNDSLSDLADHNDFASQGLATPFKTTSGAVASSAGATWLTIEIYRQIGTDVLAEKGQHVTAAARKQAVDSLFQQIPAALQKSFRAMPQYLQDDIASLLVVQNKVTVRAFKGVKITVDPKYGFWNPKRHIVCPPTGCPAAGASSTTGG
jgi:hypothetical protein